MEGVEEKLSSQMEQHIEHLVKLIISHPLYSSNTHSFILTNVSVTLGDPINCWEGNSTLHKLPHFNLGLGACWKLLIGQDNPSTSSWKFCWNLINLQKGMVTFWDSVWDTSHLRVTIQIHCAKDAWLFFKNSQCGIGEEYWLNFIQDLHEVHIFGNLEILVMYLKKA